MLSSAGQKMMKGQKSSSNKAISKWAAEFNRTSRMNSVRRRRRRRHVGTVHGSFTFRTDSGSSTQLPSCCYQVLLWVRFWQPCSQYLQWVRFWCFHNMYKPPKVGTFTPPLPPSSLCCQFCYQVMKSLLDSEIIRDLPSHPHVVCICHRINVLSFITKRSVVTIWYWLMTW